MTTPLQPGVFVNVSQQPLAPSITVPGEGVAAFAQAYNIGPTQPVQISSWTQFQNLFGTFAQSGGNLLHHAVYQYLVANRGSSCFVCRIANTDATTASLALDGLSSDSAVAIMTIKANSPGAWGNSIYVAVTGAAAAGATSRFNLLVYSVPTGGTANASTLVETFPSVSANPADPRFVANVVNSPYGGSQHVNVTMSLPSGTYVAGTTDPAVLAATPLATGADGTAAPALGTAIPAAFDTLQDQVLYLNVPGLTTAATINSLLTWADGRGDVMLVIDGPTPTGTAPGSEVSSQIATNYINMVTGGSAISPDANATLYAPWLYVPDPSSSVVGAMRFVPPGGAVLAIWDRAKRQYGIQQAPAGNWATVGAQALEVAFTATDLANLNNANINAIKAVPNVGFCVYGARTLNIGFPNRYINVQRTLIQITHDLENLLSQYTFQQNNATLWSNISNTLTTYLTTQMQAGVLAGSTPATSFSVTCDATNNTPTSAASGYVYVTVGVALSSPAEFLVINLNVLSGSATISS